MSRNITETDIYGNKYIRRIVTDGQHFEAPPQPQNIPPDYLDVVVEKSSESSSEDERSYLREHSESKEKKQIRRSPKSAKPRQKTINVRRSAFIQQPTDYPVFLTYVFVAANIIMFLYTMFLAEWKFEAFHMNPTLGPSIEILVKVGAKETSRIVNGEAWRLFTAMWLHAGVVHLALNMVVLLRIGSDLERAFGAHRVGFVYLASGISGNLLSSLFSSDVIGVGASGAIYGLIGALFGDFLQNHKTIPRGKYCYLLNLTLSTVIGLAIGLVPLVDNFGHIGGFICGFLLGSIFFTLTISDTSGRLVTPWYSSLLAVLCSLAVVVWFLTGFAVLLSQSDAEALCPKCHYLNCLETPFWDCTPMCQVQFADGSTATVPCGDL